MATNQQMVERLRKFAEAALEIATDLESHNPGGRDQIRGMIGTGRPKAQKRWSQEDLTRLHRSFVLVYTDEKLANEFGRSLDSIKRQRYLYRDSMMQENERAESDPQHRKRWTDEERQKLQTRAAEGLNAVELSFEFGRTVAAVKKELWEIQRRSAA